ncbi:hypothetical protein SRHO_G00177210 [Serrasalmus rhombeus]
MDTLKPPEHLKLTGNVDSNWRTFKQQFLLYVAAIGLDTKPDTRKIAVLLTVAGPQAIEVYNTFLFREGEDKDKFEDVLKKFDAHCSPKKNETYERYVFRSRTQQQHEPFDNFLTDLKLKAQTCNFDTLRDSMIRDQIVFGVSDKKMRERLLREAELTLEGAIKICQASELAVQHVKTFNEPGLLSGANDGVAVGAVFSDKKKRGHPLPKGIKQKEMLFNCKRCGSQHLPRRCPAFGKQCSKCNGRNHFAKQCFSRGKDGKKAQSVNVIEDTDLSETFFVGMLTCENSPETKTTNSVRQSETKHLEKKRQVDRDKWVVPLEVNGTVVALKLDTGAKANLISLSDIKAMKIKPKIKRKSVLLKNYNGQEIDCLGTCRLKITVKYKVHHVLFSVVAEGLDSLLGDKACEDLNLVKRVYHINSDSPVMSTTNDQVNDIVQGFSDVFKGFGVLPQTYKIQLKENAQPVVHPARRVPAPLRTRLKKELDRMTMLGVIKKTEEPTDWVNSMVCVRKKNGDLRVCIDPKDLNENIKREHYQIPKREEITSEMSGAKYFTKLDASQGFWQVKLDEDSTKYCTFNTPYGRYSFLRLPFGIVSASEIFHRAMEHVIEALEGVRVYIDDIIIWGSSIQEHNERLTKVLQSIRRNGLKLNKCKCQFAVQEIVFLGDKLTTQGIKPDEEKVSAIQNMSRPLNKKGVLRVMGMVNFLGKFIPNLAAKTSHLRELLHKENEFRWTVNHEREWQNLKTALTTAPVLTFFDTTKSIKISTDASKDGLGAVLLQAEGDQWKPVAYASRTMTESECRYAQIEKECLGLVFGLERFHGYVYGLPNFTVETDHRPLIAIIKKNLNEMSPRIQRLMMKLQRYDFDLIYTPGKYLVLADALSRAPASSCVSSTDEDVNVHVNMVSALLPVSDTKSKQIAEETVQDTELQAVIKNMLNGWPAGSCPQYYHIRGDLSCVNGLLLKQNRIVIPRSLRKDLLQRIHEGHLGVEKCKRRARETVYWPGINQDIERIITKCETCQKHRNKQTKQPMLVCDLPTAPWEKVGVDLFHLKGKDYLVVIDYYSNFPEMALLSSTSASCVIIQAKSIFARHGIPNIVVSDNGPCFSCKEWQEFSVHYDFKHVTSSPLYAQSNGKAEKGVHILKTLLKKAADSNSDPYLALLSYRASPLECGLSPAELLMNRRIRTTLPFCSGKGQQCPMLQQKFMQQKAKQKTAYDRSAKCLQPLSRNDKVRIEGPDTWDRKATVLQEVAPRSYVVRTEEGQVLRRNRRSLLKTPETVQEHNAGLRCDPML